MIIATALGTVVTSLVNDVIMPPIGLALGGVDFTQLKIVLRAATGGDPATEVATGPWVEQGGRRVVRDGVVVGSG